MSTLKPLKTRIQSIKSTQKITAAMKLVASSHFKKAECKLQRACEYTHSLAQILEEVKKLQIDRHLYLDISEKKAKSHLLIVVSGNRGLCGGYNLNVGRKVNTVINDLHTQNQTVSVVAFGSKVANSIQSEFRPLISQSWTDKQYDTVPKMFLILDGIIRLLESDRFQKCSVIYTSFRSIMSSVVMHHSLFPYARNIMVNSKKFNALVDGNPLPPAYEIEPAEKLLDILWKEHLKSQIYFAISESMASEHSARMFAMDSANKNAKEMLGKLELLYNKTRQSIITKELIEIISGSESL